jgi:release factor glutamine methyltransferase
MRLVREVLSETTQLFSHQGIPQARRQAEDLLCDFLAYDRPTLYTQLDIPFPHQSWAVCQAWVQRRLAGEPLAYICGNVHFYDCTLKITPAVLIPRQETEVLVDKIVQDLKTQDLTGKILWDLCCGSGCMGIALKKHLPALSVYLSDISAEALALARDNADRNQVEVTCVQGDLLAPFRGKKAHIVVCNPPYIAESEYLTLEKEVRAYEPKMALVGGATGREFYERLAHELPAYLYPQAKVWLEIGYQQGSDLHKLFQPSRWKARVLENDWAGHHRFFFLENE